MPPEYFLGAAVAIVIVVLVASFFRSGASRRRVPDQSVDTAQLVRQLSRIADSLEKLVVRLGASPPQVEQRSAEQPAAPLPTTPEPKTPEPTATAPEKNDQPSERRVKLSMFGR